MKHLKWTTVSEWVDKDTGEIIPPELQYQYTPIKKNKSIKIIDNEHESRGIVKWTTQARRLTHTQSKLF